MKIINHIDFALHEQEFKRFFWVKMGIGSEQAQDCGKCGKSITGKALKVKDRAYCEEKCFSCTECLKDLKAVPTYSRDDKLFCERCYREKFVPKCSICNDYILEVGL